MIQHAGSITSPTLPFGPPAGAFGAFAVAAFASFVAAGFSAVAAGGGVAGFSAVAEPPAFGAGAVGEAPVPWAPAFPANSNVDITIAVNPDFERRIQTSSGGLVHARPCGANAGSVTNEPTPRKTSRFRLVCSGAVPDTFHIGERMPKPSLRTSLIPFSPIRTMFRLADEMERAGGGPVVRLHVGDPDFAPPGSVVDETSAALRTGRTHYAATAGVHELRVALVEKLAKRNGIAATLDQIVITPGSTQGLFAGLEMIFGVGEEVLVPQIYWPNYVQQIMLLGGRPLFYPLGPGYQPDVEAARRLITPRTRGILINSPSNPTGAVFPESTIRAFFELA